MQARHFVHSRGVQHLGRDAFTGRSAPRPVHVCRNDLLAGRRALRTVCALQQQAAAAEAAVPTTQPTWSSYVSRRINLELALEEVIEGALKGHADSWEPELAVVFVSSSYVQEYSSLIGLLRSKVPSLKHIAGSTGYGVIGSTSEGPEEIEHAPALSLTLGSLPGTAISLRHITGQQLPDGDAPPQQWAELLGVELLSPHPTNFILLAEPEFTKLAELTDGLDFAFPAAHKIGGLISAGKLSPARAMFAWSSEQQYKQQLAQQPSQQQQQQQQQPQLQGRDSSDLQPQPQQQQQQQQQQAEVTQEQQQQQQQPDGSVPWPPLLRTGAVVMSLQGPVEMELLIAQGCRPVSSSTYTIDSVADGGPLVMALRDERGRKLTPLEALQRELEHVASNRSELLLLLRNMAVGLMPELLRAADVPPPEAHDFLIRGMALSKAGFMVVGDSVRVGQKVRFMVRDREGAQQDLTSHCLAYKRRELAAMMGGSSSSQTAASKTSSSSSSGGGGEVDKQAEGKQAQQQEQLQQQMQQGQPPLQEPQQQQQQPPSPQQRRAFGMLLFSCNGRGMSLYDQPSYDSRTLASYIPVPCSGFMCNGEIGSLGGSTHLHGFTCAAAVLRAVTPAGQGAAAAAGTACDSSSSSHAAADDADSEAAGSGRLEPGEDTV